MKKPIFYFFAILSSLIFTGNSLAATQDIVINEIGASEPSGYEWLEIYNRGQNTIDLAGWKFVEDFSDSKPNGTSHTLNFTDNTTIAPGQYAIIAQDQNKFLEKYPSFAGLLIDSSWGSLNESGEKIGIKDADGNFSEIFNYPEAKNYSLERKDFNLSDYTFANWQEHQTGNTAGKQNSTSSGDTSDSQNTTQDTQQPPAENTPANIQTTNSQSSVPSLIANAGTDIVAISNQEITLDASKSQNAKTYEWNFGDGSTSKEKIAKHTYAFPGKYIVILAASDGSSSSQDQITITIHPSGTYINEFLPSPQGPDNDNEWIEIYNSNDFPADLSGWILSGTSKKFTIPQGTFIAPKNYLVLTRKITKISLGNSTGSLRFYYPENILVNELNYEKAKEGVSASRKQDGNFVWTKTSTPSSQNIFSSEINSSQSLNSSSPQSVTKNTSSPNNLVIKNETFISSENSIVKNLINAALAQTVQKDAIENAKQEKEASINTQNTNNQNKEAQANIGEFTENGNIFIKLLIVLAMGGIFVLIWRVVRRSKA